MRKITGTMIVIIGIFVIVLGVQLNDYKLPAAGIALIAFGGILIVK